ncbi:MAG: cytidylate kinase-like family protein [Acidobacteriota bacterium]
MAIITISRGSHTRGKEVAELVARRLGYSCISREILLEASEQFNVPEIRLQHAIRDVPSFFKRFSSTQSRYVAYIQLALLRHLLQDNTVYHGLAGHFFVQGISHVLKVRIIADIQDRIALVMERDKISAKQAERLIINVDRQRKKWGLNLYGIDTTDSQLYDLVINTARFSIEDAVDIICHTVQKDAFRATTESRREMENLVLRAEINAVFQEMHFNVPLEIHVSDSMVTLKTPVEYSLDKSVADEIEAKVKSLAGVREVRILGASRTVHTNPFHNI